MTSPDAAEPTWRAPDYAAADALIERDLTLGSGEFAVPGTLTVPREVTGVPAVLLLAGSGPCDRDETIAPGNKVFKDLAWGLAVRGIASLRFDKITRVRPAVLPDALTVDDEYRPAVEAVSVLGAAEGVDPDRVHVLGHSLGAVIAPRIAATAVGVRSLVLLAAGTERLPDAMLRQVRYNAAQRGDDPDGRPEIADLARRVAEVERLLADDRADPTAPALGVPLSYWRSLRELDPVAEAAATGLPVLLLQGDRDYQVLADGTVDAWTAGMAPPDLTVVRYPEDDHQFFVGEGPSTPASYRAPQHVDPRVIEEIARWCAGR